MLAGTSFICSKQGYAAAAHVPMGAMFRQRAASDCTSSFMGRSFMSANQQAAAAAAAAAASVSSFWLKALVKMKGSRC